MADASFYKDFPNRKDRRRHYYDSRAYTRGCRNHGPCTRCNGDRTFAARKAEPIVDPEYADLVK